MDKNRLEIFLCLTLMLCNSWVFTQSNSFSFSYTPAITKLSIKNFNNQFNGTWRIYLESKESSIPTFGYDFSVKYSHKFRKIDLGIGISYIQLGQQSGLYYQWKGFSQYPNNYAGTNYVMTYTGIEFPLVLNYRFRTNKKTSIGFQYGIALNFMLDFKIQDFIVEKRSGIYVKGCCSTVLSSRYGNSVSATIDKILNSDLDKMRIVNSIGFKVDYDLLKNLSLSFVPILKFYTNSLKQADNFYSLDADAFLFGTQLNLNLKF
jgi:hypothetical protein